MWIFKSNLLGDLALKNGRDLRVPNGVFQTVFFRFLTAAGDRGKPLQRDEECLKTPVFLSILVAFAVADSDHPLNAPL